MYPSLSVIFFTTASGAGYGLLALLGLLVPLGGLPRTPLFGFVALALALGAITAGLLSSMLHLGQPRRAWRAFSQWRIVLVVARGRRRRRDLCSGRPLRHRLDIPRQGLDDGRPCHGAPCRRHRLLHGNDLQIAEAHPALAQSHGWCPRIWRWPS